MLKILVIDKENDYHFNFFQTKFTKSNIDFRLLTDIEKAKQLLNKEIFQYIFIGDIEDISWIAQTHYADANVTIISYTANPTLFLHHREQISYCYPVPFHQLTQYIEMEEILS
jgi:hypothetical protein